MKNNTIAVYPYKHFEMSSTFLVSHLVEYIRKNCSEKYNTYKTIL